MIIEINRNNLLEYKVPFIEKDYLEKEFQNNPFAKCLILMDDDTIIGYLYYSDIYDRIEINQIEIEKSKRNCGKGTILMKYFTEMVDKNITLEVKEDNLAAIKLYENFGFEKKATRKGYYQGIDGILMERKKDSY